MNRSLEYARAMLAKAREDQRIVEALAGQAGIPAWGVGFHAQQAVEKSLKAVLSSRSIHHPRTHDLALLLDLLREARVALPPDADILPSLTPFAVEQRYPLDVPEPPKTDLGPECLSRMIQRMLDWAEDACKEAGP